MGTDTISRRKTASHGDAAPRTEEMFERRDIAPKGQEEMFERRNIVTEIKDETG